MPANPTCGTAGHTAKGARHDSTGLVQRGAILRLATAPVAQHQIHVLPVAIGAAVVAIRREPVGHHGARSSYVVVPNPAAKRHGARTVGVVPVAPDLEPAGAHSAATIKPVPRAIPKSAGFHGARRVRKIPRIR